MPEVNVGDVLFAVNVKVRFVSSTQVRVRG
jgi:hypothetical protein